MSCLMLEIDLVYAVAGKGVDYSPGRRDVIIIITTDAVGRKGKMQNPPARCFRTDGDATPSSRAAPDFQRRVAAIHTCHHHQHHHQPTIFVEDADRLAGRRSATIVLLVTNDWHD